MIEFGYAFIGKYTAWFIPLEATLLMWNIYVIIRCRNKTVTILTIITLIIFILKRIFMTTTIIGSSAIVFLPLTLYWLYKCCLPKQKKRDQNIWG